MNNLIFFILNQSASGGTVRQVISDSSAAPVYKTLLIPTNTAGSFSSMIFRALGSLIVVIAIMFVIIWFLRKFSSKNGLLGKSGGEKIINVIAKSALNSKQAIYVVEVPERILILGVSGDNINILSEIKEPSTIKSLKEGSKEGIFAQYLKGFTLRGRSAPNVKNNASQLTDKETTSDKNDKSGSGLLG
ncbi:MAG: flagellar biosynthetic protein FliO [bacterium]|nr:flagellar biosynthetic protein FliO [bacterium]